MFLLGRSLHGLSLVRSGKYVPAFMIAPVSSVPVPAGWPRFAPVFGCKPSASLRAGSEVRNTRSDPPRALFLDHEPSIVIQFQRFRAKNCRAPLGRTGEGARPYMGTARGQSFDSPSLGQRPIEWRYDLLFPRLAPDEESR